MTIKKATISDVEQLSKLFDEYRVFYQKESDVPNAKAFISERLKNKDSEIFVAASDDGILMGFVQLYPQFSSTRMKRLWLLNDLFVNPNYREQHIAVLLIDKAKELAKETHSAGLTLATSKTNRIGNTLYPRTNFELDQEYNYYHWTE